MTDSKDIAAQYFRSLDARDWQAFRALLDPGVVYQMPQSRERINGRDAYLKFNQDYPGDWHLAVHRIVADGGQAAVWVDARVGDEHMDALVWLEINVDGHITGVNDFWPESYQPPAGREHLVERY